MHLFQMPPGLLYEGESRGHPKGNLVMSNWGETLRKTRDTPGEPCFTAAFGRLCTFLPYEEGD